MEIKRYSSFFFLFFCKVGSLGHKPIHLFRPYQPCIFT
ncbi:unnamed protein product [Arabidopsis halleri]